MYHQLQKLVLAGLISLVAAAPADNGGALPPGIQFVNGVDTSSGMLASTTVSSDHVGTRYSLT